MRGLIVDCYGTEGRGDQIKTVLSGFEIVPRRQLSAVDEEDWEDVADDIRALLEPYDFVLLHVGQDQKFTLRLLQEICGSQPVFCYKGGPSRAGIEEHCGVPGLHVLSPGQFARSDAGALPTVMLRWLKVLGPNPSQETAKAAWREVRRIDPAKEEKIKSLDAALIALMRTHNWTPNGPISKDLRAALKSWREESGAR